MSGGAWRSVLRIFGAGIAALFLAVAILFVGYELGKSAGFYDAQANGHASQDREITARRVDNCLRQVDRPAALRCAEEAIKAGHDYQRSEYDLAAQREMADWTFWLWVIAFVQTPITAVGIILLLRNIQQADDALAETRRIGEAQTKAYLSVTDCSVMFKDGKPSVKATFSNSGQSPALKVRWHAKLSFMIDDDSGHYRQGETAKKYRRFAYDVPAQGHRETLYTKSEDFELGPDELGAFQRGADLAFAVHIFAHGRDVFKNPISAEGSFLDIFKVAPRNLEEVKFTRSTLIDSGEDGDDA